MKYVWFQISQKEIFENQYYETILYLFDIKVNINGILIYHNQVIRYGRKIIANFLPADNIFIDLLPPSQPSPTGEVAGFTSRKAHRVNAKNAKLKH
jgi:hypothetical protein